ncbi:MAG: DUF5686 family protein [Weeksellaceae bacterium]|jgi:hypothetical protein|nr:DUF5686 family protein [Weeksellaceae bacterium]
MNKLLFFIYFCFSAFLIGQTKITVLDGYLENTVMEGVVILSETNQKLGETNSQGVFIVPANIKTVKLYAESYEEKKLFLYGKDIVVTLNPLLVELEVSQISSDDSEARNWIKQLIQNRKKNSIQNLKSYQYKSYTKFLVTASTDSMPYILFPKTKKDSSYNEFRQLLDESHLMLGERAMDHKFSEKYGFKNILKASRISGTQLPMYEFAVMQPISIDFDENYIELFFAKFSNPLSNAGLKDYRYRISSYEELEGRSMVVIAFFPKTKLEMEKRIKGYVWIDMETKALTHFVTENLSEKQLLEMEIEWERVQNYWIPKQQRFRMDGGSISYPSVKDSLTPDGEVRLDTIKKKEKVWLHLTTSFSDFESPVDFDSKEFKGYTTQIDFKSHDNSNETLNQYRNDSLSLREMNTYVKIDSIGKKHKVDKALKLLRVVTSGGKLDIGNYFLDITKLVKYNDYEGLRLGLGGGTNYKFNENFSVEAYVAYGFKDKKMKFGGGLNWYVNKAYSGKIFTHYAQDVDAIGKTPIELQNNYLAFFTENLVNIYNPNFYSYRRIKVGYQQDLSDNFTLLGAGVYNEKTAEFDYFYRNSRPHEKFLSMDTQIALRWAPKEKNIQTPYGKVTIQGGLPVFYFSLIQGWNVFNADYTPTKMNFHYFDEYRTFLGRTSFQFHSGIVLGKSPIIDLYEGTGNAKSGETLKEHFGLAGLNNFETMLPSEFYSDRFIKFNIAHRFAGFKIGKKEIFPLFIYRGLLGNMKNPQDHSGIYFLSPSKLYQEGGIEFNRLFAGLGIGAYYRMGHYAFDEFEQNFFLKLTLKMDLF